MDARTNHAERTACLNDDRARFDERAAVPVVARGCGERQCSGPLLAKQRADRSFLSGDCAGESGLLANSAADKKVAVAAEGVNAVNQARREVVRSSAVGHMDHTAA